MHLRKRLNKIQMHLQMFCTIVSFERKIMIDTYCLFEISYACVFRLLRNKCYCVEIFKNKKPIFLWIPYFKEWVAILAIFQKSRKWNLNNYRIKEGDSRLIFLFQINIFWLFSEEGGSGGNVDAKLKLKGMDITRVRKRLVAKLKLKRMDITRKG